ncbi:glycosyl hydrolase 53 family protein, partial [Bacillus pumilus]|uniref:glycosyl hydrolase 53 family protein n=1 Tax=Bacillus pumilus TaxID=1408 RepID=UPI0034D97925
MILHLPHPPDNPPSPSSFHQITKTPLSFHTIPLSYYPYSHPPFTPLTNNINHIPPPYQKHLILLQTPYPFTTPNPHNLQNSFNQHSLNTPPYPASP